METQTPFDSTPPTPRTPHSNTTLSLPRSPSPSTTTTSGPPTPLSCISTIAIKDGHEGHRPDHDGNYYSAERISRLSYFDRRRREDGAGAGGGGGGGGGDGAGTPVSVGSTEAGRREAAKASMIDGMTYDEDVVDTTEIAARMAREETEALVLREEKGGAGTMQPQAGFEQQQQQRM